MSGTCCMSNRNWDREKSADLRYTLKAKIRRTWYFKCETEGEVLAWVFVVGVVALENTGG